MKYRKTLIRRRAGAGIVGSKVKRRKGKSEQQGQHADADSHLSPVFRDEQGNLHLLI
jgi:hypothetical protein